MSVSTVVVQICVPAASLRFVVRAFCLPACSVGLPRPPVSLFSVPALSAVASSQAAAPTVPLPRAGSDLAGQLLQCRRQPVRAPSSHTARSARPALQSCSRAPSPVPLPPLSSAARHGLWQRGPRPAPCSSRTGTCALPREPGPGLLPARTAGSQRLLSPWPGLLGALTSAHTDLSQRLPQTTCCRRPAVLGPALPPHPAFPSGHHSKTQRKPGEGEMEAKAGPADEGSKAGERSALSPPVLGGDPGGPGSELGSDTGGWWRNPNCPGLSAQG